MIPITPLKSSISSLVIPKESIGPFVIIFLVFFVASTITKLSLAFINYFHRKKHLGIIPKELEGRLDQEKMKKIDEYGFTGVVVNGNHLVISGGKVINSLDNKSALFIDMHHIISDGTSLSIFIDELCKLYNNETLEEIKFTYKDFAEFENKALSSGKLNDAEKYWVSQFENDIPVLNMPTNYSRPAIKSYEGAKVYSKIDSQTLEKINKIPGIELSSKDFRKFIAEIRGNINGDDYVKNFSWVN